MRRRYHELFDSWPAISIVAAINQGVAARAADEAFLADRWMSWLETRTTTGRPPQG